MPRSLRAEGNLLVIDTVIAELGPKAVIDWQKKTAK